MIPFLDMKSVYAELKPELDAAFARVMESGWFVLGKEVEAFEAEYAAFCGTRHCVGVGNGLEALELVLRGWDLGAGDEVIVPSNTYIATWLAVTAVGAKVVPVEPTPAGPNIDPERIAAAITLAHAGDHAGPSLRRAGRHGRHHGAGAQARAESGRGRGAGAGRQGARPARRARWAMPARTASFRPRISAPSAMAARSRPTTRSWPTACACCATTAARSST